MAIFGIGGGSIFGYLLYERTKFGHSYQVLAIFDKISSFFCIGVSNFGHFLCMGSNFGNFLYTESNFSHLRVGGSKRENMLYGALEDAIFVWGSQKCYFLYGESKKCHILYGCLENSIFRMGVSKIPFLYGSLKMGENFIPPPHF